MYSSRHNQRHGFPLLIGTLLVLLQRQAWAALPLQMLVNLRGSECLYDKLNAEYVIIEEKYSSSICCIHGVEDVR